MSEKIASIIGATGMIGNYLREEALNDHFFDTVRLVVRRPLEKTGPRLEIKLVDFDDGESFKLALEESHTVFCCIGTTQKRVKGDNDLYRKIDFDIPARAARFAKEAGCSNFVIITSVGANRHSNTFYLRLKGELEYTLHGIGLDSVHIMQPSMLLGERNEKRSGENFLQGTMKMLSGLFFGSFRKFRAIHGRTVAKAMLNAAKTGRPGFHRYTFDEIVKLAEGENKNTFK